MRKSTLWIWALLALTAVIPRVPWLGLPLENDSGANAFLARQMLRGNILYDRFHTAHHLPGIYYTFAFAFKIFGDSPTSPKILLFFFIIATCWGIYLIGRDHLDETSGILGAVFYALVSSQALFSGTTAAIEHFANLPLTVTIFLLLHFFQKGSSPKAFFWVGVLSSISVLFKIVYIAPLATAGFSILISAWLDREKPDNWKILISRTIAISIGFILPLTLTASYYAGHGLWDRFILVFKFGFKYFSNSELSALIFPRPFGFPLFVTGVNNAALLAIGLIGTYRFVRRSIPAKDTSSLALLSLSVWLILSFASTGLRGGGYEHYVLIVLPPLALAAGFEISSAYKRLQNTKSQKQAKLVSGLLTATVVALFFAVNFRLYVQFFQNQFTPISTSANPFASNAEEELAEYIKTHTSPDDFIYLWGNNVQLYYYADRVPPIDILWPDYVGATGSPERIFTDKTTYIILENFPPAPQWLLDGLVRQYSFETTIAGRDFYRLNNAP